MNRPASPARQNGFVRFLVILLGYLAACYVAGLTIQLIIMLDAKDRGLAFILREWPGLFLSPVVMTPFIAVIAAIPAFFAITAGEAIPRRDWPFYTVGGLIAGAVLLGAFTVRAGIDPMGRVGVDLLFAAIMICGGSAAGFAYWAIAGRGAGGLRSADGAGSEDASRPDSREPVPISDQDHSLV